MKLKFTKSIWKINPAFRNKYTHFILFKSNIDTMGAIFKLSKITGVNQKLFSTAGLKDKRGITTQKVSVFNTNLEMLQKFYAAANRNK
jgi:tRNA pseudouridine13 synthase